jgi:hypothetical protein
LSVTGAGTAVPMPLAHTVKLNAVTADTEAGPRLHANWMRARSALDCAQVSRLSRLWWLRRASAMPEGVNPPPRPRTSAQMPARASKQQIDELEERYAHR